MNMRSTRWWLVAILLLAATFRFIGLTHAPPALNWDEVSIGYNAFSILKTGRDEWGEIMPLAFKAFGEHKLPGMIYASIPGVALFGTTDLGVRVTPAILGVIAVYLLFKLTQLLTKQDSLALISAGLLALSPWGIHFSRVAFEAQLALVCLLGFLLALSQIDKSPRYIWLSMLLAVTALYTYNAMRIIIPCLLIWYALSKKIEFKKYRQQMIMAIIVGCLLIIPIIRELSHASGRVRLGTIALHTQESFYAGISESRGYTKLPSPLPQLIHNKYTHYVYQLGMNYLQTFSTEFLFFEGGSNSQRSIQGMGLLHLFELPLLLFGVTQLHKHKGVLALILPLLLVSPLPSALTVDAPSSVRALSLLPALLIIESLAVPVVYERLKNKKLSFALTTLFVGWNVAYLGYQMWYVNPVKYSDKWLYGYKQAIGFTQKYYNEASRIYLTSMYGEPYIYTLFYTHYDPHTFQTERVERETDPTGWIHVKSFDKYVFSDFAGLEDPQEIVKRNSGTLVMVTGFGKLPGAYQRDLQVSAPNWLTMFEGTVQKGMQ